MSVVSLERDETQEVLPNIDTSPPPLITEEPDDVTEASDSVSQEEDEEEEEEQHPSALTAMIDAYTGPDERTVVGDMNDQEFSAFLTRELAEVKNIVSASLRIELKERPRHEVAVVPDSQSEPIAWSARREEEEEEESLFLPDDTVLTQGDTARSLFQRLMEREDQEAASLISTGFRSLGSALGLSRFTWADHRNLKPTLQDYILSGVHITDLWSKRAARTYLDLKNRFRFSPGDLIIDPSLFSASHLAMLYRVTWKELLIDFGIGPEDYLLKLKLKLPDLCTLQIDIWTLVEWPWKDVFQESGRPIPGKKAADRRISTMRKRLDRKMFMRC